jgi:hypothetical protein
VPQAENTCLNVLQEAQGIERRQPPEPFPPAIANINESTRSWLAKFCQDALP